MTDSRSRGRRLAVLAAGIAVGLVASPGQAQAVDQIFEARLIDQNGDPVDLCGTTYATPIDARIHMSIDESSASGSSPTLYDMTYEAAYFLDGAWKTAYVGTRQLSVCDDCGSHFSSGDSVEWVWNTTSTSTYTLCGRTVQLGQTTGIPLNFGSLNSTWLADESVPLPEISASGSWYPNQQLMSLDSLRTPAAPEITFDPDAVTAVAYGDTVSIGFTASDEFTSSADLVLGWDCVAADGATASGADSPITFVADVEGRWDCTAWATDEDGLTGSAQITVSTADNLAPVPSGDYRKQFTATSGETITFDISAEDPEGHAPLSCDASIKDDSFDATISVIDELHYADGRISCTFAMTADVDITSGINFFIGVSDAYGARTSWMNHSTWQPDPGFDDLVGVEQAIFRLRDVQVLLCSGEREKLCHDRLLVQLDQVIDRLFGMARGGGTPPGGGFDDLKRRTDGIGDRGKDLDLVHPSIQPEVFYEIEQAELALQ